MCVCEEVSEVELCVCGDRRDSEAPAGSGQGEMYDRLRRRVRPGRNARQVPLFRLGRGIGSPFGTAPGTGCVARPGRESKPEAAEGRTDMKPGDSD